MTILLLVIQINSVVALEYPEITNDVEIKYRWYKEIITGDYYPLQTITSEDKINISKIQYGRFSYWKPANCSLSKTKYDIEKKEVNVYKKVKDVRYILLENFVYDNNIKIYYQNKEVNFDILSNQNNEIKIDLKGNYIIETLLFVINRNEKYKINFYDTNNFKELITSKEIDNQQVFVVDKSWNISEKQYIQVNTETNYPISELTQKINSFDTCRYREIYVYKYETTKEYYDGNYYSKLDGYIKDQNDYKIFYKGEPITNTVEIINEKIIKQPVIEYIYIEKDNNKENDSSKEIENNELNQEKIKDKCIPKIKTETIEKEIVKVPKKIYITIVLLIIVIILLMIKLYKKYVR